MQRITFELEYHCYYPINELIEYLKGLDGIDSISFNYDGVCPVIDVKYDDTKINYKMIFYETCAFCEEPYDGSILSFDQHLGKEANMYELNLDGLICDFCYRGVIRELFSTNGIISIVNSYCDFWEKSPEKVRIKLYYDDKIISKEKLVKICNKIKEDHC